MPRPLLWKQVTDQLADQFEHRHFTPGERFFTLKELSTRYRISEITGRRVMDELQARHLIECIQGKGTFVRRTAVARSIKLLLHPLLSDAGFSHFYLLQEILAGMHAAAQAANCQVHPVSSEHFADHARAGDLVASVWHSRHLDALHLAMARGAHVACAHAPGTMPGISTVRPDFAAGIALATRHLIDQGHARIAYVTGAVGHIWFARRFDGYFATLRESGLPLDLALVRETACEQGGDVAPALAALLALDEPPTAVVCANDARALAVMHACRARGLRIPDQLAVVGFDNTHDAALASPTLTTIDQFWRRQGEETVAVLLRQDDGQRGIEDVVVAPALVRRESA